MKMKNKLYKYKRLYTSLVDFSKVKDSIISNIKNEPDFMREFRIRSFECFEKVENPSWGPKIDVDFDSITYYKKRKSIPYKEPTFFYL